MTMETNNHQCTVTMSLREFEKMRRHAEATEKKVVELSMDVYDQFTDLICEIPMDTSRDQVLTFFKSRRESAEKRIWLKLKQ